jgi:hypothetical protein
MSRFVVRQQRDRLADRKVTAIAVGGVVTFCVAVAVSGAVLGVDRRAGSTSAPAPSVAPMTIGTVEQGLLVGPARGLDFARDQRATLDRWAWVDRDAGIATIPVERAMDLVAADAGAAGKGGTP